MNSNNNIARILSVWTPFLALFMFTMYGLVVDLLQRDFGNEYIYLLRSIVIIHGDGGANAIIYSIVSIAVCCYPFLISKKGVHHWLFWILIYTLTVQVGIGLIYWVASYLFQHDTCLDYTLLLINPVSSLVAISFAYWSMSVVNIPKIVKQITFALIPISSLLASYNVIETVIGYCG